MNYLLVFGSFNPITNAHIALIEAAKNQIKGKNTEVIIVPSNLTFMEGWKDVDRFIPDEKRILTLQKTAEEYGYEVSLLEANGKVDGKTFNTVKALNLPEDARIYFCFGDDKIKEFPKWYKAPELFGDEKHTFLIANRLLHRPKGIISYLKKQNLVRKFKVFTLENNHYRDMSSTAVRKAFTEGDIEYIKNSVPSPVYEYLSSLKTSSPREEIEDEVKER